jgi:hypothetical protein
LASFFQNATLILLGGTIGSDLLLKLSLPWKGGLLAGLILGFSLGLLFATETKGDD